MDEGSDARDRNSFPVFKKFEYIVFRKYFKKSRSYNAAVLLFRRKKSSSIDGIRRFSSAKKSSIKFTWTIFCLVLLNRNRHKQSSVIAHALKTYWIPGVFFSMSQKSSNCKSMEIYWTKSKRGFTVVCFLSSRIFIVAIQVFDDSCKITENPTRKDFF